MLFCCVLCLSTKRVRATNVYTLRTTHNTDYYLMWVLVVLFCSSARLRISAIWEIWKINKWYPLLESRASFVCLFLRAERKVKYYYVYFVFLWGMKISSENQKASGISCLMHLQIETEPWSSVGYAWCDIDFLCSQNTMCNVQCAHTTKTQWLLYSMRE